MDRCKIWIYGAAWGCACATVWLAAALTPALAVLAGAASVVTWIASRRWLQGTVLCLHTIVYWLPAIFFGIGYHRFHMAFVPWMIALLIVIGRHRTLRRWYMPRSWQRPVVGWAVLVALSWPIGVWRELHFILPGETLGHAVNNIRGLPALTAAFWVARTALMHLVAVLWLDTLYGDAGRTDTRTGLAHRILHALRWGWIGVIAVAILQAFVDLRLLNGAYWIRQARVSGALRDANALGTLAATWILMPASHNRNAKYRCFRAVWLGVGLWTVWISGSRAAVLMLGIGLAWWSMHMWFRSRHKRDRRSTATALQPSVISGWIGIVCVGMLTVLCIPPGIDTGWKRITAIARAAGTTGSLAALWAQLGERPVFWKSALAVFLDAPLTGIGPGGVDIVLTDYAWRHGWGKRILPFESALNAVIQFFAEYGLLGGMYFWIAIRSLWRSRRFLFPPDRWTALGLAWVVSLCFGVHIQHPAVLWTLLPLIVVWMKQRTMRTTVPMPGFPKSRTLHQILGIAVLYSILLLIASVSVYFPGLRPRV